MVKVGNSECEFLKLTPLSRISAIAGAVSGVTFSARRPSGMNRIRLRGVLFSAEAGPVESPADSTVSPADSNTSERRIKISPCEDSLAANRGPRLRLVSLHDGFVTRAERHSNKGRDPALRCVRARDRGVGFELLQHRYCAR